MDRQQFITEDSRWGAVTARNPSADLHFVYGVRTTKIYCRPICKARLARRTNVVFFDKGQEAKKAGFRACKRCKPEISSVMPEEEAEIKIRQLLAQPVSSSHTTSAQMALGLGLSKWHFHRTFKRLTGKTPYEYFASSRESSTLSDPLANGEQEIPCHAEEDAFLSFDPNFDFSDLIQWSDLDSWSCPSFLQAPVSDAVTPLLVHSPE